MPEPIVHKRTSAAPKQVIFPHRRHNTRSGATRAIPPTLKKRQSTLTQLDFVSTPHSSRDVIPDSTDEDEDEDEDEHYPEQKPKKRRKLSKKLPDQSTLTQNWRRVVRDLDEGSSGDELGDWEDDSALLDNVQEGKAQDTQGTGQYLYGRMQEVSSEMHELLADGQSEASPAFMQHRMLVASSEAGDGSTRPSTAELKVNPKTPKTNRRTEVPSSQTPSSAILSLHKSRTNHRYDKSPLKGRSWTPTPLKELPGSQTSSPSNRMLRHMESNVFKMDSLVADAIQSESWKAEVVSSPVQKLMPDLVKRRLIRTATVQDSQDDLGLAESPENEPVEALSAKPETLAHNPDDVKTTGRSLKRANTILDSEAESDLDDIDINVDDHGDDTEVTVKPDSAKKESAELDVDHSEYSQPGQMTLNDHNADEHMDVNLDEEGDSHEYNYTASLQQHTFDPVSAALDRDAARFGHDPTQLITQHHSYAGFGHHIDEDDFEVYEHRGDGDGVGDDDGDVDRVDDSEPEFVAESPACDADPETQFVADSPPSELQHAPSSELNGQAPTNIGNGEGESAGGAVTAVDHEQQSMGEVPDSEDLELPMLLSPKLPRPSQVSTVMPTQHTASRPNSGHGEDPMSPQKSAAWANAFSSSPFPLPPESWRGAQSYRDLDTQSSNLWDFSLPPPPPLLSSARHTPASFSR